MPLPSANTPEFGKHLFWIIHHGSFVDSIEWKIHYDDTKSNCFIASSLKESDYSDDPLWNRVLSKYQIGKFTYAIAFNKDPIVDLRIDTVSFIECKELKKLCFVFHRNDNGRKLESMKRRECWIYLRDRNGNIAAKSKLIGLHGYDIRGRIDVPDDLTEFRVELKELFECNYAPNEIVPSIVTAISDMWLEDREYPGYKILSLNDDSDPEPSDEPGPGPDPGPSEYATAVTPEVPDGIPYQKIWFNEEGLAYRGDRAFGTEYDVSSTDTTSITDKLKEVIPRLPDALTPNKYVVSDSNGKFTAYTDGITPKDESFITIGDQDITIEEDLP